MSESIHSMKFFIRASPYTTNGPLLLIASDVSVVWQLLCRGDDGH